jgi:hypothetical protein
MATLSSLAKSGTFLFASLCAAAADSQRARLPEGSRLEDIVVTGTRDIVVNGRTRKCRPPPGDPLGRINLPSSLLSEPFQQSVVKTFGPGQYELTPDDDPVTGPDVWQRAGRGLSQYVFHVASLDHAICIGADAPDRKTFAQLRRIVSAKPFWGKRVRFTAWVATNNAAMVNFWLASARRPERISSGGNTNNRPWGGHHGWTPILIEIGPVKSTSDYISYGFLLRGAGDVWVYKPEFSTVSEDDPLRRTGDVSVFGGK